VRPLPQLPTHRDVERARSTARLWVGLTVLFAGIAVMQWFVADDLWVPVLSTVAVVAYAGSAWQARQRAREVAARSRARDSPEV
jgi:hypothetical protein